MFTEEILRQETNDVQKIIVPIETQESILQNVALVLLEVMRHQETQEAIVLLVLEIILTEIELQEAHVLQDLQTREVLEVTPLAEATEVILHLTEIVDHLEAILAEVEAALRGVTLEAHLQVEEVQEAEDNLTFY